VHALLVAVMTVSACGVPGTGPRAFDDIPAGLLDTSTTTTSTTTTTTRPGVGTTAPPPPPREVRVYVVDPDGTLFRDTEPVPVDLGVGVINDARERVQALLQREFTAPEVAAGYTTAVDAITVQVTGLTGRVLDVDLQDLPSRSLAQQVAFAQLVYTITETAGVGQVRFSIDGEPGRVLTWSGEFAEVGEPVDRTDYFLAYEGNKEFSIELPSTTTTAAPTTTLTTVLDPAAASTTLDPNVPAASTTTPDPTATTTAPAPAASTTTAAPPVSGP
jgi:hypothetical protein